MKKTNVYWFIVLFSICVFINVNAQPEFKPDSIESIARKVGGYRLSTTLGNGWIDGAYFTGIMALYELTGDEKYRDSAEGWANYHDWILASEYNNDRNHADNQACAQTYCELYMLDSEGSDYMISDWRGHLEWMIDDYRPRGRELWWWCDALFMAPPAFSRLYAATGETRYLDTMDVYWKDVCGYLYDETDHLFYRDDNFFYPEATTANGRKVFWSRGNGWVIAGLARVLEDMPGDYHAREWYETKFLEMASALASRQGSDGMWRSSLNDSLEYPDPEMSGTCFFCFGLTWGINNGYLSAEEYGTVVRKAWSGMVRHVQPDGALMRVQEVGYMPGPAPENSTRAYAEGAFCLAAEEIYKMIKDQQVETRKPVLSAQVKTEGGLSISVNRKTLLINNINENNKVMVEIRKVNGSLVKRVSDYTDNIKLSMARFPAGVYLVRVVSGGEKFSRRVVWTR